MLTMNSADGIFHSAPQAEMHFHRNHTIPYVSAIIYNTYLSEVNSLNFIQLLKL